MPKIRRCARCNGLLVVRKIPNRGLVTVHANSGKSVCPLARPGGKREGTDG